MSTTATLPESGRVRKGAREHVTVVVEVKGNWNDGLLTSQTTQLAERYLPEAGTTVSIYVVGWFPTEQWNRTGDSRRAQAKKLSRGELVDALCRESGDIRNLSGLRTYPIILDIPRPSTSGRVTEAT